METIGKIDLHSLTREDVEKIDNEALRRAVIRALFLEKIAQDHTNHNEHSNHTKYSESIKEEFSVDGALKFIFGGHEKTEGS